MAFTKVSGPLHGPSAHLIRVELLPGFGYFMHRVSHYSNFLQIVKSAAHLLLSRGWQYSFLHAGKRQRPVRCKDLGNLQCTTGNTTMLLLSKAPLGIEFISEKRLLVTQMFW